MMAPHISAKNPSIFRNDNSRNNAFFHCVKSVRIRSFFWSVFSRIRTEYGDLRVHLRIQSECGKIRTRKSPNTDTFYAVFRTHLFTVKTQIPEIY